MEKTKSNPEGEWWWLQDAEEKPLPEKFRVMKQWVRDCDPVFGWPLEARLERVRRNVMKQIYSESEETNSLKV